MLAVAPNLLCRGLRAGGVRSGELVVGERRLGNTTNGARTNVHNLDRARQREPIEPVVKCTEPVGQGVEVKCRQLRLLDIDRQLESLSVVAHVEHI